MDTQTKALPRVVDALAFAADAHRDQRRKDADATPYINHPLALIRILAVDAGIDDVDVLCAAALHDYLEDCCDGEGEPTVEEGRALLRERFGSQVLTYVAAVSDDKSLPKAERKRLQIKHAVQAPHGARLVKLADKIANLRDIADSPPADWPLQRRQANFDWAKSVVDELRGTPTHSPQYSTLPGLRGPEERGRQVPFLFPNVMETLLWVVHRPWRDAGITAFRTR